MNDVISRPVHPQVVDLSIDIQNDLTRVMGGVGRPTKLRTAVAYDSMLLAFQLHASIAYLIEADQFGAAHALLRPLVETSLRTAWTLYVAKFEDVERIRDGTSTLDFNDFIDRLAREPSFPEGQHFVRQFGNRRTKRKALHSLAHMGIAQLHLQTGGFARRDVVVCCRLADIVTLFAAAAGGSMLENRALIDMATQRTRDAWINEREELQIPYDPPLPISALPKVPDWPDLRS